MKLAVIIPVHNGEKYIHEALRSVFKQTLTPDEIIVVDDDSTDATVSIVRNYCGVKLLESPGSGPSAARNHGLRETDADKVAFRDHDDLWHPEHLQRLSRTLNQEANIPAAVSGRMRFRNDEKPQYSIGRHSYSLYDPWKDYPSNGVGPPFALIRRDALRTVDGWPTEYDGCEDYYLWLRLGLSGPLAISKSVTAAYRMTESSYSTRLRKNQLFSYYKNHVSASRKLVKLREKRGLDTKAYWGRYRAQEATLELLKVLLTSVSGNLRRASSQLDQNICEKSRAPIWDTFLWYLQPYVLEIGTSNFATQILDLIDCWPYENSELRNMLQEWAYNHMSAADLLDRNPWSLSCWRHLLNRGYGKMCTRSWG